MMEALLLAAVSGVVLFLGPLILSVRLWLKTRRLRADVDALVDRVRRLESEPRAMATPAAAAVEPAAAPHPPPEGGSHESISASPLRGSRLQAPDLPPEGGSHESISPPPPRGFRLQAEEPPSHAADAESLESRIGGRWLLYVGIAAIVIGAAYFEKLAIDSQWIGETARVIQGAVLGAVFVYAGLRFTRGGYPVYGQMLTGGGIAVLYVSTYAAFNYYQLVDRSTAFALLVAITGLGAFLADRQDSQGLAIFAVGGGFLTPFLLPANTDAQMALFTYDAILIAGTVFLAGRRQWPFLHVISYVFTLITVAAWADRFYAPSKYLPTEIFLTVFCAMFTIIARWCRRSADPAATFAAFFLWTAPAAYYLASLVVLEPHAIPMLVWLIGLMLTGAVLSVRSAPAAGFGAWIAVAAPLLAWTQRYRGAAWLSPGLATIAGVYLISLAAQLQIMQTGRRMRPVEIAWLHMNALVMFAGAYFLLWDVRLAVTGTVAAAFAAWHGTLAGVLLPRHRDHALHCAALAFSLLAIALALQFDGPAVTIGWAAEGAALIALGLHERRDWMRAGGAVLLAIAVVRTLVLLAATAPANHVVIFNPRAATAGTVIALAYAVAWLHRPRAAGGRNASADAAILAAHFVSVVFLTSEIRAFFAVRGGAFTREMTTSVAWAAYATVLIVTGLFRRYAPIRYFGIALFGITIVKVFFADLAQLQRIYRVLSIMGLGVLLLLTSYLYQRMRGTGLGDDRADEDPARLQG